MLGVSHAGPAVSDVERFRKSAAGPKGDAVRLAHHAERVRTHRAPRRGLKQGHLAAGFGVAGLAASSVAADPRRAPRSRRDPQVSWSMADRHPRDPWAPSPSSRPVLLSPRI